MSFKNVVFNRLYEVTARVTNGKRYEESTGAVPIVDVNGQPFKNNDLTNAIMQAATKATRRATLAFCGLSFLDESERDTFENQDLGVPSGIEEISSRQVITNKEKPLPESDSDETHYLEGIEYFSLSADQGKNNKPFYKITFCNQEGSFIEVIACGDDVLELVDSVGLKEGASFTIQYKIKKEQKVLTYIKKVTQ